MINLEEKLKPLSTTNLLKLETIESINDDNAKSLLGKNIQFTWIKDDTKTGMVGRVLGYFNNKLRIYTMNILNDEEDNLDNDKNIYIEYIDYSNLRDIVIFEEYTKEFWELTDVIELTADEEIQKNIYEITTIFGDTIECIVDFYDSFTLTITVKNNQNKLEQIEYPLYFVGTIRKKEMK